MDIQDTYLRRLVGTIKLLAAPAEIQLSAFPNKVCKPDEIALTFDEYACQAEKCELLSDVSKTRIAELNRMFDLSIGNDEWTEDAIYNSDKWENVRKKALELLNFMNIAYTNPSLYWISDIE